MSLLCDSSGVPLLIQNISYSYRRMMFIAEFFNGESLVFTSDQVCSGVCIMDRSPSRIQMLEAENNIHKLALRDWRKWFPYLRVVA
jgi:hypothetical protein